jgi:hypothetical protein
MRQPRPNLLAGSAASAISVRAFLSARMQPGWERVADDLLDWLATV